MAIEDRSRHDRLRALLPRAYATDARDSVLGVLLDALADGLRGFDQATERALRDKWLATAEATRAPIDTPPVVTIELGGEPRPLEHLGSELDLLRQPWEADEQAYRGRVALLAPRITRGLGTTRSLLSFSITALGGEPCPLLERSGDATIALGLPPGRLARCRACHGGQDMPSGPCPLRAESTMSARLVDNPRGVVGLRREAVDPGHGGSATIHFDSDSLFADRPELELRIPPDVAQAHVVPSFRSRQTGERIVVAHVLRPGETLRILPQSPNDPNLPPHMQQWVDRPNPLSAVARVSGIAPEQDVPIISILGVSFDGARFGVDRFAPEGDAPRFDTGHFDDSSFDVAAAGGRLDVTTPAVVPGANTWDYVPLAPHVLAGLPGEPAAGAEPLDLDAEADLQPVALRLRWWTRPTARFQLRIPLTPTVRGVVALGAADYLRRMVDRVRPAGVTAVIDFLEPPIRESLDPSDGHHEVVLSIPEPLSPLDRQSTGQALPVEVLEALDGASFGGLFDVTPFGLSHLQP